MDNLDLNNNKKYGNYSKENGQINKNIDKNSFSIKKKESNICSNCERENDIKNNYCKYCGLNQEEVVNESKSELSLGDITRDLNIRKVLLTAATSVVILLLLSILLKGIMFSELDVLGEISYLINPIHIMMALNLGFMKIYSSTMIGSSTAIANIGLIILLIFPILALTVSNLIFMKNQNKSAISVFKNSLGVGISYGLILVILGMFTKKGINPYDIMQHGYAINFSYNYLNIFLNGCILGFLCTYFIGFNKKYQGENMYLDIFKKAFNTILIGYFIVLIIISILSFSDSSYLAEMGIYGYSGGLSKSIILSQLAAYMWAFANFIPTTMINSTLSVFNIGSSGLFMNTKLIFYSMIALSSLIILVQGCKLESKYEDKGIKPVIVFSIFYAAMMGVLSIFTGFSIFGNIDLVNISNYGTSVAIGFSTLLSIIISFVYSFVVAIIGYKLNIFN